MRRIICGMLIIGLLHVLCACQGQDLPAPAGPVDSAAVAQALQQAGLPWTIAEEDAWFEGQTVFMLHMDGGLIASIASGTLDGERLVTIAFPPHHNALESLPQEDWERALVFAALLYGGFESPHQLYDRFNEDYDTINTVKETRRKPTGGTVDLEQTARWEREINGVNCRVDTKRPYASISREYLRYIQITSDVEAFFPEAG